MTYEMERLRRRYNSTALSAARKLVEGAEQMVRALEAGTVPSFRLTDDATRLHAKLEALDALDEAQEIFLATEVKR